MPYKSTLFRFYILCIFLYILYTLYILCIVCMGSSSWCSQRQEDFRCEHQEDVLCEHLQHLLKNEHTYLGRIIPYAHLSLATSESQAAPHGHVVIMLLNTNI